MKIEPVTPALTRRRGVLITSFVIALPVIVLLTLRHLIMIGWLFGGGQGSRGGAREWAHDYLKGYAMINDRRYAGNIASQIGAASKGRLCGYSRTDCG
jgi:hypothetical protein